MIIIIIDDGKILLFSIDYQFPAPDSNKYDYGLKQERQTRRFNPLKIPISIERELPFKSRPKVRIRNRCVTNK